MLAMARKKNKKMKEAVRKQLELPDHTKQGVMVVILCIVGIFLTLAGFNVAGPAGNGVHEKLWELLGVGYFLLPTLFFLLAANALRKESSGINFIKNFVGLIIIPTTPPPLPPELYVTSEINPTSKL